VLEARDIVFDKHWFRESERERERERESAREREDIVHNSISHKTRTQTGYSARHTFRGPLSVLEHIAILHMCFFLLKLPGNAC